MNKKIYKGYELFKMIANNELNENCKIKDTKTGYTATYDGMNFRIKNNEYNEGRYFTETFDDIEFAIREFELLEDNTEEIEELDKEWTYIEGQVEKTWSKSELELVNKINELVKAVKAVKAIRKEEMNNG